MLMVSINDCSCEIMDFLYILIRFSAYSFDLCIHIFCVVNNINIFAFKEKAVTHIILPRDGAVVN